LYLTYQFVAFVLFLAEIVLQLYFQLDLKALDLLGVNDAFILILKIDKLDFVYLANLVNQYGVARNWTF
jgi:hypothetical protein